MDINSLITLLTAMGGIELLKWLYNKKSNSRIVAAQADKEEANADKEEFAVLKETIEFLQKQNYEKETRFAEQTAIVRKQNDEIMNLTKEKGRLELELAMKRCEVKKCALRQPQNGY